MGRVNIRVLINLTCRPFLPSQTLPTSGLSLSLPEFSLSSEPFNTDNWVDPQADSFMEMLHSDSFNDFDAFLGCLKG